MPEETVTSGKEAATTGPITEPLDAQPVGTNIACDNNATSILSENIESETAENLQTISVLQDEPLVQHQLDQPMPEAQSRAMEQPSAHLLESAVDESCSEQHPAEVALSSEKVVVPTAPLLATQQQATTINVYPDLTQGRLYTGPILVSPKVGYIYRSYTCPTQ